MIVPAITSLGKCTPNTSREMVTATAHVNAIANKSLFLNSKINVVAIAKACNVWPEGNDGVVASTN